MERLKGFRELYPEDAEPRREVFETIERVGKKYGFEKIESPSLEPLSLYEKKSGEEIVGETFSFKDKSGREVTLTPELTPSLARMFSNKEQELSKPVKWFCAQKLWRYEQPQAGRLREFYQPNFDIFGSESGETELIALAHDILTDLGLSKKDFLFKISHRSLTRGIIEELDINNKKDVYKAIDKREKISEKEFKNKLNKAGLEKEEIDLVFSFVEIENINEISSLVKNDLIINGENEILSLFESLDNYGILDFCEFDPSIVRGLDYYTGIVFECFDSQKELRSILGGGRYDELIENLGGPSTPAVGLGIGDATLELLMKKAGVWPDKRKIDYYIAVIGEVRDEAINIAKYLRNSGYSVDIELSDRSFSEQLRHADSLDANDTIIVGERDLSDGFVTVKDMHSGEQQKISVENFKKS